MNGLTQRADYTFKYNQNQNRHGWLRLTPAYSVKLAWELVSQAELEQDEDVLILDPFSGTATTGLLAAQSGLSAHLFEINPFLIWLGRAKCAQYTPDEIDWLRERGRELIAAYKQYLAQENWIPPIHNIERWWSPRTLAILAAVRRAIVETVGEPAETGAANLIWVGFCRLIIETSAAAFNHVSMSFQEQTTAYATQTIDIFLADIFDSIFTAAAQPINGSTRIFDADARFIQPNGRRYSHIITSPPYPNRISYIRELRPYMYWTKFLRSGQEAGELDWAAIGGTWGVATSRLKDWQPTVLDLPGSVTAVCQQIEQSDNKNALLMSRYVHKYFHDMAQHLRGLRPVLQPGVKLAYIVGNSTFYGIQTPTHCLLRDLMEEAGYRNVAYRPIRKRNSKKELFEYHISAYH
jgi:hypothetical protein